MASRPRDVIVIGGSAGAIEAVGELFQHLPADLPARVAVTLHRHPHYASQLGPLFSRRSPMSVVEPEQGEAFQQGRIYLAPQDRHMTVFDDTLHLDRQPQQHHTRPAIDPLFRSAARAYGSRTIGVLLTGNLSDGVTGLIEIKEAGGLSLVQDPAEAQFPSMPQNALIYDHVDLIFEINRLAELLVALVEGAPVTSVTDLGGVRPVREADIQLPPWVPPGRRP